MPRRINFNPKLPLVAARAFTFLGKQYQPGDPFAPEGADQRALQRQYEARAVNHGEATAAAEQPVEQVTMTGPAGGRYTITAPWLAEPEVVRGKTNAEKRLAELQEAGPPLGFIEGGSPVTVKGGEGGWYEVNAPWLDEPEKVQGREAAESRQRELHDAGEPASYKGYTITPGENGWYAITKDGVESDTPTALNVHGEEAAREAVATLRAGQLIEGTALPEEWNLQPEQQPEGGEQGGNENGAGDSGEGTGEQGGENAAGPASTEAPGGEQPQEGQMADDDQNKDKQTADTAPNEPGTNEPNGAEVINDQENAERGAADGDGDGEGDGTEGGDGTTGTVGP